MVRISRPSGLIACACGHRRRASQTAIAGSRLFRPATGAMEDAENVDSVANDAVRQDVRRTRYGKLPRFCESSRGDRFRQSGKLALGTIHDARNHRVGSTLTVLRHVRAERAKVR